MNRSTNQNQARSPISIALLGNPNTGKSTLFNGLTGIRQQTGNIPGVTVEKRIGKMVIADRTYEVMDLPGCYSLAPHTPDEMVTVNVLLGNPPVAKVPDLIVCVIDANNLRRNLYLVSQLLDLHLPIVIAVNMIDVAKANGIEIDCPHLAKTLGVPVVPIQANKKVGFAQLADKINAATGQSPQVTHLPFTETTVNDSINRLISLCPDSLSRKRFVVTRMLFDTEGFLTKQFQDDIQPALLDQLSKERNQLTSQKNQPSEYESQARYDWIDRHLGAASQQNVSRTDSRSAQVDRVLTHPFFGIVIAIVVLVSLFQLVFWAANPASDLIEQFNLIGANLVNSFIPPGALNSLLIDGLINGVGSVLIFLPQILLLFLVLAVLEDSGYLARAAFLMDKYLSKIGISGISLFPLLSSFACAVPGIMASRVIRNQRERLITILIAPLMSCSARLPVYVLLIAAFVPDHHILGGFLGVRGLIMLAMYGVGIVAAIMVAWILKKTLLKTGTSSFVMELPSYKIPSLRTIWQRMFDGGWAFVRDAGTMIVAVTILVWAAIYFPRSEPADLQASRQNVEQQLVDAGETDRTDLKDQLAEFDNRAAAYQLRHSYLGQAGILVEPVVRPLGWDWRIGSAAIASFPAREVVVSTMGVIFGLGSDLDETSASLKTTLQEATWEGSDRKLFTLPVALSVMVFFSLCAQCVSTLAAIRRETNSLRWPLFTLTYMTVLAYIGALVTYQVANWIC